MMASSRTSGPRILIAFSFKFSQEAPQGKATLPGQEITSQLCTALTTAAGVPFQGHKAFAWPGSVYASLTGICEISSDCNQDTLIWTKKSALLRHLNFSSLGWSPGHLRALTVSNLWWCRESTLRRLELNINTFKNAFVHCRRTSRTILTSCASSSGWCWRRATRAETGLCRETRSRSGSASRATSRTRPPRPVRPRTPPTSITRRKQHSAPWNRKFQPEILVTWPERETLNFLKETVDLFQCRAFSPVKTITRICTIMECTSSSDAAERQSSVERQISSRVEAGPTLHEFWVQNTAETWRPRTDWRKKL